MCVASTLLAPLFLNKTLSVSVSFPSHYYTIFRRNTHTQTRTFHLSPNDFQVNDRHEKLKGLLPNPSNPISPFPYLCPFKPSPIGAQIPSVALMAAVPASHLDLECGGGDGDSSSVCFSDAEEGSCCSQFYSTADGDGSHDEEGEEEEIMESRRASSVAESDCSVAVLGNRVILNKSCVVKVETDCRICHLSLDSSGPESGVAIELGCSCKNDLAASHKHCAEEWFRIKGNRVCEICNSIAQNVVIVDDLRPGHQINDTSSEDTNTAPEPGEPVSRTRRRCPDGRFLNFVLALMVFAFVLSWLFHFNVHA